MGVFVSDENGERKVVLVPEGGFYRTFRIMHKKEGKNKLFCSENCFACKDHSEENACGRIEEFLKRYFEEKSEISIDDKSSNPTPSCGTTT